MMGDCLEKLKDLEDNSIDSIVCDPPYGLGFMGKKWDYSVPSVDIWVECLRVLKPGGHLLAFAGTRTQHRMAVNIEDAGFEIRDMIAWVYGSGFPKSMNVASAIEKMGEPKTEPDPEEIEFCSWLRENSTESVVSSTLGKRFWDCEVQIVNTAKKDNPIMGRRSLVPTSSRWQRFKDKYGEPIPDRIEQLAKPVPLRAETPGEEWKPGKGNGTLGSGKWAGWGTALKPAVEPVTWAQKPFTVVPPLAIMEAQNTVALVTCLSLSSAKYAETLLTLSPKEYEEVSVSALLIAGISRTLCSESESEKTDMFRSPGAVRTILSIVESWKIILDASSSRQNMFTTSMATSLTTALRILSCSILQTMHESIAESQTSKKESSVNANTVVKILSALNAPYSQETSAQELVSLLTELNNVLNVDQSFAEVAKIANTVLRGAITDLEEKVNPPLEPVTLARKPLSGTVAANVLEHGTGALNVDGCRVAHDEDCRMMAPSQANIDNPSEKYRQAGRRAAVLELKPAGRWPANLIHDGSDEVVSLFPDTGTSKGGNSTQINSGSGRYNWNSGDNKAKPDGNDPGYGDSGSAARFFYCAKASKKERGEGNNHPTVKPIALMQYLCRLVTPPGGTVLDPFMGSGTSGVAALNEGLSFIGIELSEDYFNIAEERLKNNYKPDRFIELC
jgi:DNA modification methylase